MTSWRPSHASSSGLIGLAGPELAADGGRVAQVFDGLEERNGLQAGIGASCLRRERRPARASQRTRSASSRASGAGDDIVGDRLGVLLLELGEHAEGGEDLGGLRRELGGKLQRAFAERALPGAELFDGSGVHARMLAKIERVQVQAEGADREDQRVDVHRGEPLAVVARERIAQDLQIVERTRRRCA